MSSSVCHKEAICGCGSKHNLSVHKRMDRFDPSRTLALQKAFIRQFSARFQAISRAIYHKVYKEDCFGLKLPKIASYNEFAFITSEQKVTRFMDWLKQQEAKGLLQTVNYNQYGGGIQQPWTNLYIEDSYKRGVQMAQSELTKADLTFPAGTSNNMAFTLAQPVHADRIGILYARAFEDLKGITAVMDTQISRVLAEGLMNGDNPMLLARKLRGVIDGGDAVLGLTDSLGRFIPAKRRAEMLARTEIMRAHHRGMIQEYRNWGVVGAKVKAEWTTSGFDVCEKCSGMEGRVYDLDVIENMIPAHPNCRCIALPVLDEGSSIGYSSEYIDNINPNDVNNKIGYRTIIDFLKN